MHCLSSYKISMLHTYSYDTRAFRQVVMLSILGFVCLYPSGTLMACSSLPLNNNNNDNNTDL
uniref:Uncharacterized protein n=1 Tax=Octopus bimaculoides TaxID=37653 RepID=A0A0L8IHR3_OCTBM